LFFFVFALSFPFWWGAFVPADRLLYVGVMKVNLSFRGKLPFCPFPLFSYFLRFRVLGFFFLADSNLAVGVSEVLITSKAEN
jgi:hypothetical protein